MPASVGEQSAREGPPPQPMNPAVAGALVLCAAALVFHAWAYWFVCDDAYISFRYARNLARGHGLVFNAGQERVEGYTNFLWVVVLAAGERLGVSPPRLANGLSLVLTLLLFGMVVDFCRRHLPRGASAGWLVVPAAFLATNRSFAVWATSGLETRCFEFLIVAGVLRAIDEALAARANLKRWPVGCALLAAATLTRPDGLLISAFVIGLALWLGRRSLKVGETITAVAVYVAPVAAHFLFRRAYYGDWLPNTYYAKVGGQTWWSAGGRYFAAFAVEYAVYLWAPLVAVGVAALVKRRQAAVVWLIAGAIVPHAVYVAAIGGDHFEYRPIDVYVPLVAVLMFFGVAQRGERAIAKAGYCAVLIVAAFAVGWMSHRSFPRGYRSGFPGITPRADQTADLVPPTTYSRLFRVPLVGEYPRAYNGLIESLTRDYVGIRQEEHAAFLRAAQQQGRWLGELAADGRLPADTYVAISCVGAIPYYSGLRALDRLGLTDRTVARGAHTRGRRLMAHEKLAEPEYAQSRAVDLWGMDNVHLIFPRGHPMLAFYAFLSRRGLSDAMAADVGDGRYLVANYLRRDLAPRERFPGLDLRPAGEVLEAELKMQGRFEAVPLAEQYGEPYDTIYARMADALIEAGEVQAARGFFERALATNPKNTRAQRGLAWLNSAQQRR